MDEQVKIWQRGKGEVPPVTEGLPALAANALSLAALYGTLARQLQGPGHTILLGLQEDERHCARCLKGIYRMVTGTQLKPVVTPIATENTEATLRKAYALTLKALAFFDSRTQHTEYGPVFDILKAKKREHCCALTELLGL